MENVVSNGLTIFGLMIFSAYGYNKKHDDIGASLNDTINISIVYVYNTYICDIKVYRYIIMSQIELKYLPNKIVQNESSHNR